MDKSKLPTLTRSSTAIPTVSEYKAHLKKKRKAKGTKAGAVDDNAVSRAKRSLSKRQRILIKAITTGQ